jgi:hypothetical protein
MSVLVVIEGGEKRGFKISEGALSVGSGEAAGLRLSSADVAEVHAELLLEAGDLFVVPKSGVLPPRVQGVEVKQKTLVRPGQELRIGSAVIAWRPGEVATAPATPRATVAAVAVPAPGPKASAKGQAAARRGRTPARKARKGAVASRGRAERGVARSKGIPTWVIVVGVLVGIGVVGTIVLKGMAGSLAEAGKSSSAFHLRKAEELIAIHNVDAAQEHVAKIVADGFDPADQARLAAVKVKIQAELDDKELRWQNARGSDWFEFKLEDYEKRYLAGDPSGPVIRVFLERCAEFRERWPKHPELVWVDRQEKRFASFDLARPLTWPDIEWKAKVLTNARPRNYKEAFELLEGFGSTLTARERAPLDAFVNELKAARATYHQDQLRFARGEYQKGNIDRAIEWLVQSVLWLGDETMADEAADILIRFDNAAEVLRGYREARPEDFELLMENAIVRRFAADNGV